MAQLDLSQDTIRQRRNMVVTSVLVIFIKLAGVTFGDKVNFLGATLSIENPEVIYKGILIFLAYFVWRFYQYFSTDNAYAALCSQFHEHMKIRTSLEIVKLICRPRNIQGLSGEYLYKNLKSNSLLSYTVEATVSGGYDAAKGAPVENKFSANISIIRLETHRLMSVMAFVFRGRILTDYFVPYLVLVCALLLLFL